MECKYIAPLLYPDTIAIGTRYVRLRNPYSTPLAPLIPPDQTTLIRVLELQPRGFLQEYKVGGTKRTWCALTRTEPAGTAAGLTADTLATSHRYQIVSQTQNKPVAVGKGRVVTVDYSLGKPVPMPAEVVAAIRHLQETSSPLD